MDIMVRQKFWGKKNVDLIFEINEGASEAQTEKNSTPYSP